MTILPAKNYIILKPVISKTSSGLEVPMGDKDMPVTGEVFKIGEGKLPLDIKIGDLLVFKKYLSNKIYIPELGEDFDFVRFVDCVAVIKKEGKDE